MGIRNLVEARKKPFFVDLIDKFFIGEESKFHSEVNCFYPSGISQCARYNQYSYLGIGTEPDLRLKKIFARGTAIHNAWTDIIRKAVVDTEIGRPIINTNPKLRAIPDLIITDGAERYMLELKSASDLSDLISWEYYTQYQIYMYLTNLDKGWLMKIQPVTWETNAIPIPRDQEFIEAIINWLRYIEDCTVANIIIEKSKDCSDCDVRTLCNSELGNSIPKLRDAIRKGVNVL